MTIKHIVLSGGGNVAFSIYGALRQTADDGVWKLEELETVYACSAGSIIGSMLPCLKHIPWEMLDDFMIKRPWNRLFNFSVDNIIGSYQKKGLFGPELTYQIFEPLLLACDLSPNITLAEYYEYCKIEMHFVSTDLVKMEIVDINYKTHPDWKLCDAVYCSMCLPILCPPYSAGECLLADGGILMNFPAKVCLDDGHDVNEILGIDSTFYSDTNTKKETPNFDSITDYLLWLLVSAWHKLHYPKQELVNYIFIEKDKAYASIYDIYVSTSNVEERTKLVEMGRKQARGKPGVPFPSNTLPIFSEDESHSVYSLPSKIKTTIKEGVVGGTIGSPTP